MGNINLQQKSKGFTLIEVLVILFIIAIVIANVDLSYSQRSGNNNPALIEARSLQNFMQKAKNKAILQKTIYGLALDKNSQNKILLLSYQPKTNMVKKESDDSAEKQANKKTSKILYANINNWQHSNDSEIEINFAVSLTSIIKKINWNQKLISIEQDAQKNYDLPFLVFFTDGKILPEGKIDFPSSNFNYNGYVLQWNSLGIIKLEPLN